MIRIALAGNPNSGKTTLFNALTGSNQYVGNWPGVTVEKKEGRLNKHDGVTVTDLPGIYSLSPYTPEEVVARKHLVDEHPDVILNIVDGTNIERNLYLTTQLMEIGIPVVIAVNMMDVVEKRGDFIDIEKLSKSLGCRVTTISALKETGIEEAAEIALLAAKEKKPIPKHSFSGEVEHALAHIEEAVLHDLPLESQRWYAIKIFERDKNVLNDLKIDEKLLEHINEDIKLAEIEYDDDSEAIIINERYVFVEKILKNCYKRKNEDKPTVSQKIDRIVTGKYTGLPIFAIVMFLVYYISMISIGSYFTNWANNGVFGEGWRLFGIGTKQYESAVRDYGDSDEIINAFAKKYSDADIPELQHSSTDFDEEKAEKYLTELYFSVPNDAKIEYFTENEETFELKSHSPVGKTNLAEAINKYKSKDEKSHFGKPEKEEFGIWIKGIPVAVGEWLNKLNVAPWLSGLILDGIISGVGAVLGFLPQMAVLFLLLAILEACGYMSRIAFVLDKIFRKFGLSGKSFIPILVGTGCGVPGIMSSRTIENEKDRKITIMTTTFIPCGAKVPFVSMIAGAIFGGSALVAASAYFIGIAAIITSGVILKKMRMFKDEGSPFVMELPEYHLPTLKSVFNTTWDRVWSYAKKAGTVILLSTVAVYFATYFGFDRSGNFRMLSSNELDLSLLSAVGRFFSWIFIPLGFGKWQTAVATITGIIAKENVVGTLGVLYGYSGNVYQVLRQEVFTGISAYSFMTFNLLCAPCVAAIGAIRREMGSAKWMFITLTYQTLFAYSIALMIFQFGNAFLGNADILGLISAVFALIVLVFLTFGKEKKNELH